MNGNELSERAVDLLKRDFNAAGKVLGGNTIFLCPYSLNFGSLIDGLINCN
jgi:hypothetical protein